MKNVTIVFIVKNLSQYTLRIMGYLNVSKCPYNIIIADGGNEKNLGQILNNKKNYPNINYEYIQYPFDSTLTEYHNKMATVMDKVKTPLTVLMSPDDFFIMESIEYCVDILRGDDFISTARGGLYSLHVKPNIYGIPTIGDNMYNLYTKNILDKTAADRIKHQSSTFHGNWHNVIRTKYINATLKLINVANPNNLRFTEQLVGYLPVAYGGLYRGTEKYLLHQTNPIKDTTRKGDFPPQHNWISSSHWLGNFNKMTEAIGATISYIDDISIEDACEKFRESYLLKLPQHKSLLKNKIDECRKRGLNYDKINQMVEILKTINISKIDKISTYKLNTISADDEIYNIKKYLNR